MKDMQEMETSTCSLRPKNKPAPKCVAELDKTKRKKEKKKSIDRTLRLSPSKRLAKEPLHRGIMEQNPA